MQKANFNVNEIKNCLGLRFNARRIKLIQGKGHYLTLVEAIKTIKK